MGLEGVEIVMKVEEAFEIAIEDAEAEKITTPRHLIDLVMGKVGRPDRAACLTQRAFHRLRASLLRSTRLARGEIRLEATMTSLLPTRSRTQLLHQVIDDVGLTEQPKLVRPLRLVKVLSGLSLVLGAAAAVILLRAKPSSNLWTNLAIDSPIFSGLIATILCGWVFALLTRNLRNDFKPAMATVGGFARWIVAHGPEVVDAPPGQWSREQVAAKVREIVIDVLGCEKQYREDAHFVKELGMG